MCIVYVLYVYSLNPICGKHDNKALFLVYIPSYHSISGIYVLYIIMIILSFIVLEDCFQIYNVSRSMYYKWIDNGNGEHLCSWNVFAVYFVLYFPLLDPKVQ